MRNKSVPEVRFPGFSDAWEQRKLGDLIIKMNGGASIAPHDYREDGVATVPKGAVNSSGIADLSGSKYVDEAYFEKNSNSSVFQNELVTSLRDLVPTAPNMGRVVKLNGSNEKYLMPQGVYRLIIDSDVDENFLISFSNTDNFRKIISQEKNGSTQVHIRHSEYLGIPIARPAIEEQRKIGSFFNQLDNLITLHQRELTTLKQTKQGFLQKMFPKEGESVPEVRFPGFSGEWERKSLKEIVTRVTRKNTHLESTLPLTISAQHGLIDQETFFKKTVASSNLEGYYLLYEGEFAYNKSYSNGYPFGAVKRLEKLEKGVLSSLYICFKPVNSVSSDFIAHYFESCAWHKEISMISVEGARNHGLLNISVNDFFDTLHKIPGFEEQQQIGNFFNQLADTITLKEKELEALQQTKKAFLQKMFV
ncbi:restriction endonuclease subunit S [Sporosarcina saromensis]|uniref:Restriction endonuclease subunit S n=1 Tax=Sporosarcina saromensis TaxID=359365 RepID=A0ABU4GBK0_9BACL|nr:restriction endonuclease subunit S [Sporosarcina saromensis]MDW0114366.1 restriction endonuclease subunit S [Sporosarcina saromensis]